MWQKRDHFRVDRKREEGRLGDEAFKRMPSVTYFLHLGFTSESF